MGGRLSVLTAGVRRANCSTPDCGFKNDAMPLYVREWQCPTCRAMHDRDVNAAQNVLAVGLVDSNACGGSVNRLRNKNRSVHCAAV